MWPRPGGSYLARPHAAEGGGRLAAGGPSAWNLIATSSVLAHRGATPAPLWVQSRLARSPSRTFAPAQEQRQRLSGCSRAFRVQLTLPGGSLLHQEGINAPRWTYAGPASGRIPPCGAGAPAGGHFLRGSAGQWRPSFAGLANAGLHMPGAPPAGRPAGLGPAPTPRPPARPPASAGTALRPASMAAGA